MRLDELNIGLLAFSAALVVYLFSAVVVEWRKSVVDEPSPQIVGIATEVRRPLDGGPYYLLRVTNTSDEPLHRVSVQWSKFEPEPTHLGPPPLSMLYVNESLEELTLPPFSDGSELELGRF